MKIDFEKIPSGKSVEGREIDAFISGKKGDKFLYLIAGTHGDEVEGVYVLEELLKWEGLLKTHYPMVVIPILNKDGYHKKNRLNARGVDLNRNYPTLDWNPKASEAKYYPGKSPLSEPENIFLDNLFKHYPPGFTMSFHSWMPLINYNGDSKKEAEFLARYNSYPVKEDIGYPVPGSLGTYLPQRYHSPVITFECPLLKTRKSLQEIWRENEEGLKELFKQKIISL